MPLDWLNTPLDVGDLIARKKRTKAIEALRAQLLRSGTPRAQGRLQLADLLVQAGRGAEAVPILLGLADEFARDGFVAKSVAVLKRIERVEPGRPDVEEKLAFLARRQHRSKPAADASRRLPELGIEEIELELGAPRGAPGQAAAEGAPPEAPAAGPASSEPTAAEEIAATEAVAPNAPVESPQTAGEEEHPEEARPPEEPSAQDAGHPMGSVFRRFLASLPGGGAEAAEETPAPPVGEGGREPEVDVAPAAAEAEPVATEAAPVAAEAPPLAETPTPVSEASEEARGVAGRIRGVFRRFLASIAGPAGDEAEPAAAVAESEGGLPQTPALADAAPEAETVEATEAEEIEPEIEAHASATEAATTQAPEVELEEVEPEIEAAETAEPELEVVASAEAPAPSPSLEVAAEAAAAPEVAEDDTMSEEVFQDRVLDVIEDVLRQPTPTPEPRHPGAAETMALAPLRLMAAPLLGELGEEELLAVVRGLKLLTYEAGEVIITEGEPGKSLFILTTGSVKVFVRNPDGRNLEVGRLKDGDFFGEISSLSGRPRTATVTAASACELLELERATVDSIAATHPRVRETLEAFYIARAGSPEAAAIRAVPLGDPRLRQQAIEALEAHFGESRWDPRMRLRLAEVLLRAGKEDEAVPVLIGLADDLAREGFPEKAIAILKKIERIRRRHIEEVPLAPLKRPRGTARPAGSPAEPRPPLPSPPAGPGPAAGPRGRRPRPATADHLDGWILDVLRDTLRQRAPAAADEAQPGLEGVDPSRVSGYARSLKASPLFVGFSEDELLAVIQGLRLLSFDAGDIIITEGEPGESLFILAAGAAKVFVRSASGHDTALCALPEGAFFGEISTLSNRPRTATVTAAAPCDLLELDKPALEAITGKHPRVREVLEEFYIERAASPEAARIRGRGDA